MSYIFKAVCDTLRSFLAMDKNTEQTADSGSNNNYKIVSVALPLPLDVLEIILSYVPDEDLLGKCVFVEQWTDIINSNAIWLLKCLRKWNRVVRPDPIPENFYRYLNRMPLGVNLINNPCGKNDMNDWIITKNNGDGWRIEQPPNGADPIPNTTCQFCFATSFGRCEKYQTINLEDLNITKEMMDVVKPQIHVSEWHAARWDCGSKYHLEVSLMDDAFKVLDRFQYDDTETQWTGKEWKQVQKVFVDYPNGVKYIVFLHNGKDTQFWKGYYGSKMSQATVKLMM